jgi:archaellum component FlaF (FlaF/FlaG flagellin family)
VNKKLIILLLILTITLSSYVQASPQVIVNSADWRDVYSGLLYARMEGKQAHFLTSTRHATIILGSISRTSQSVEVFSSRNNQFIANYESILVNEGYQNVQEFRVRNGNLEILDLLPRIDKYIIVDDSYGYNAISVAPLASLGNYYVIFSNRNNANQIINTLENRNVRELIIYGQVDRSLRNNLEQYNPTIINTGDRFDNNIEAVKLYQTIYSNMHGASRKQAILTNGEFIESSIMNGADPVLFIGFTNVPDQVREYITRSELEVGTLIGNELIGAATFIRRQTGLSVFVKFGQGARVPEGAIAQVEDLDRFPIPRYELNLGIVAAVVNTATNNLEVTYRNYAPIATYFRPLNLRVRDSQSSHTVDLLDLTPTFIDGNDFKTMLYPLIDGDGGRIDLLGENKTLELSIIYGESPKSLEQSLETVIPLSEVSIIDGAEIDIIDVVYNSRNSKFSVKIRNTGTVNTYATAEIIELIVDGETLIFGTDQIINLRPGKTGTITIETTMEEEDVQFNEKIRVKVLYGERETSLIKVKEGVFDFKYESMDVMLIILIILIIMLLLLFFITKKCDECKTKNPHFKKTCRKCKKAI